jgi:hypothetical protein
MAHDWILRISRLEFVPSLPTILRTPPTTAGDRNADRERRRQTDRRRGTRERRRLSLNEVPSDDRRNAAEERRSGLDRRVRWTDAPPRPFPLEQYLVRSVRASRIGTLVDLRV